MRVPRSCIACGGVASLAIEQASRSGRGSYACPACGASNEVVLPVVRSSGERVRVDTGDEPDDGPPLSVSQLQMLEAERRLAKQST